MGRTLPLQGPWEGSWQEPATPMHPHQSAGNGCRYSGVRFLCKWFLWSWTQAQPVQAPDTHTVPVPADHASTHPLSDGSSSPLHLGASAQDPVFLYMCFSLPLEDATQHRQAQHSAGILTASSAAGVAPLLAPHKYYLSHTLGAVGQLYNKSCIPLVRFQLLFSATCFP